MENKKLTWGNLRFEIKLWLLSIVVLIAYFAFTGYQHERLKDARFEYVFPQGMKPIALMRDYAGELDDVWLCETESGEYVDCTIWAIIDPRGNE